MRFLSTAAAAVMLVGAMGGISLAQSATGDSDSVTSTPPAQSGDTSAHGHDRMMGGRNHPGGWNRMGRMHGMPGAFLRIACSDRGAEALEIGFIHIKYAVKPNPTQAPLLDALRTAALSDQKNFADACQAAMQQAGNAGRPTMLDHLERQQALVGAYSTALNDVVPKFRAFYDSLSDQQKAELDRSHGGAQMGWGGMDSEGWSGHGGGNDNMGGMHGGRMHGGGMGQQDQMNAPSSDQQDEMSAPGSGQQDEMSAPGSDQQDEMSAPGEDQGSEQTSPPANGQDDSSQP